MHKRKYTKKYYYAMRIISFICILMGLEIIVFGGIGDPGSPTRFEGIERGIAFTPLVIGYIFGIVSNEIKQHL